MSGKLSLKLVVRGVVLVTRGRSGTYGDDWMIKLRWILRQLLNEPVMHSRI